MAGGMYGKKGRGLPIGMRSGIPEPPDARPWEADDSHPVPAGQRHVLANIADGWHEALALKVRPGEWGQHVLIAWVVPGEERARLGWLPIDLVQPVER